jgi:predicted RNA-binding Zn-ribbon protein involved in translation (DUF1610 family)
MTRKLTEREIERIILYYERGLSRNEIKKRTGRSLSTINKYIKIHLKKTVEFTCPKDHRNIIKKGHLFRSEGKKYFPCKECNCAYEKVRIDLKNT